MDPQAALQQACVRGDADAVARALADGADINAPFDMQVCSKKSLDSKETGVFAV
jgi:hypothetical protein